MIRLKQQTVIIDSNQTSFDDGLIQIGTEGGAPRSRKSVLNSWHRMTIALLVQDGDSVDFYAIWNKILSNGDTFEIQMRAESNALEWFECQIVAGSFSKTFVGNGIHQWTGQVWVKPNDDNNDEYYEDLAIIIEEFGWNWRDFINPYDALVNYHTLPLADFGQ